MNILFNRQFSARDKEMNPGEKAESTDKSTQMQDELREEIGQRADSRIVDANILGDLNSALSLVNLKKSDMRRPIDRHLAICATEIEKVIAFYTVYCK